MPPVTTRSGWPPGTAASSTGARPQPARSSTAPNLTAAHMTLPLPSYVRVTNLENDRSIVLRVNDRGPYAHGRLLDVSEQAAELLAFRQSGSTKVRVQYISRAPKDVDDMAMLLGTYAGPTLPVAESMAFVAAGGSFDPGARRGRRLEASYPGRASRGANPNGVRHRRLGGVAGRRQGPPASGRLIPPLRHRHMQSGRFGQVTVMVLVRLVVVILTAVLAGHAQAQLFDTKAPHALLMDYDSGTVLFEKAADERVRAGLDGEADDRRIRLQRAEGRPRSRTTTCSPCPSTPGGRAVRRPAARRCSRSSIRASPVRDLLRGLIVQSGNDAAIVLAEGIAGSEPAFADRLNKRAAEIGLKNSRFQNANGLHDPDQLVTARDLAILARHIIRDYPDYYPIFSEPEFTWNKIRQPNRNPLLGEGIGVDGLKTGYIKESGYGIVASAVRNEQRLILVIAGLDFGARARRRKRRSCSTGAFAISTR